MVETALLALAALRAVEEAACLLLVDLLVRGALAPTVIVAVAVVVPRIPAIVVVVVLALVRIATLLVQLRTDEVLDRRFRQAGRGWLRRRWRRSHHVVHLHMHELRRQLDGFTQLLPLPEILHPLAPDGQVRALCRLERHLHGWRRVEHVLAHVGPINVDLLQADPGAVRKQLESRDMLADQVQLEPTSPRLEIDILHLLVIRRHPNGLSVVIREDLFALRMAAPHMGWIAWFGGLRIHPGEIIHNVLFPLDVTDQPTQCINIWGLPLGINTAVLLFQGLACSLFICRTNLDRMAFRLRGQDAVDGFPDRIQMTADQRLLRRAVLLLEARGPRQTFDPSPMTRGREQFSKEKSIFFPETNNSPGRRKQGCL